MKSEGLNVVYIMNRFKYNIVYHLVKKKQLSPKDIVRELKAYQIESNISNDDKLQSYVQRNMGLQWNPEKNKWVESDQLSMLVDGQDMSEDDLASLLKGWKLKRNDAETFIKDVKGIVSSMKSVSKQMEEISKKLTIITVNMGVSVIDDKEL